MDKIMKRLKFDEWSSNMRLLALATFLLSLSLGLKETSFTNYVSDMGIKANQLGWIESIREVPGFLTVIMAMLTYFITESVLAALSLFVLGIGMFVFSFANGFYTLIAASFIYSIGFHLFFPLQSSMALKMGSRREGGKQLGRLGSVASTASLCGMGSVILLSRFASPRTIFLLAMVGGILGGLVMLKMQRPESHLKPKTLIWRREYKFYYILTFLSGCRRHIFTIFAPFVLVNVYGVNLTTMATLMTLNQLINIYTKQRIGKLIDKMGEKVALTVNFSLLFLIFLGYAYVKTLPILFLLYMFDNVCFGFNMAISTYLHKICADEDLSPSLAMGSTVNHIAAVFIPVIGGMLWDTYGYQFAFFMGAGIALVSLLITYMIKDLSGNQVEDVISA